jgi:hypothetical protein
MSAQQLEFVRLADPPGRGTPLLAVSVVVRVGGDVLEPCPKKRPRATIVAGHARVGMDPGYRRWLREALALFRGLWGSRESIAVPVVAEVVAVFSRPQRPVRHVTVDGQRVPYPWSWTAGRTPYLGQGGDADNVAGAVLDALQPPPGDLQPRKKDPPGNAPLLDDRLVVELRCSQCYAAEGEEPQVEVRLWTAGGAP